MTGVQDQVIAAGAPGEANTEVTPARTDPVQASTWTNGPGPEAEDSDPRHAGAVPTTSPLGAVPLNPRTNGPTKSPAQSASSPCTAVAVDESGRPTS